MLLPRDEPTFVRCQVKAGLVSWQSVNRRNCGETRKRPANPIYWKEHAMKLNRTMQQAGATGYILLWLLGIPIHILLLIFLLSGCT
jgi:hypothetical protein